MDEIVTTRLDKQLLDQIDKLVTSGRFTNRSDAIRSILIIGMNDIIKKEVIGDLVTEIEDDSDITDEELINISQKIFDKPISEIISEEREK